MDPQNLAYALVQLAHNFGAVAVTGGAAAAAGLLRADAAPPPWLARLVLGGWALQAASGAGFGAISYAAYGQFPDLHGIAVAALAIKMGCAALGIGLGVFLGLGGAGSGARRRLSWHGLLALAVVALSAAAFLRWFS